MIRRSVKIVFVMFAAIILHGCFVNMVKVKQDTPESELLTISPFTDHPDKLPLVAGLFIPKTAREYLIYANKVYALKVGEALEADAFDALKKVFRAVSVIKNKTIVKPEIERIIKLGFSPVSKIEGERFGKMTVDLQIEYEVCDNHWNSLWKGTVNGGSQEVQRGEAVAAAILFPALGAAGLDAARGELVNKCIISALEDMNDQILGIGKKAILNIKEKPQPPLRTP